MRDSIPTIQIALSIGVGGFVGALARWATTCAAVAAFGPRWPVGTFIANGLGCLVLGALRPWSVDGHALVYAALLTGFCGAYTTFSTFALDAWMLNREVGRGAAVAYLAASVLTGLCLLIVGLRLGEGWRG